MMAKLPMSTGGQPHLAIISISLRMDTAFRIPKSLKNIKEPT